MKTSFGFHSFIIGFVLMALLSIQVIAGPEKEVTITGLVTAWEWDEDNNVTAVAVSTDDDDYVVDNNDLGEELMELIDHEVEVTGTVSTDEDDLKTIVVTKYKDLGVIKIQDEESDPE